MTCKRFLVLFLAIALLAGFTACGGPDDPMLGEWTEDRDDGFAVTYRFRGNGKGEMLVLDLVNYFDYTYDDAKIYAKLHVTNPPLERVYDYKIEGDKLTLSYTSDNGEVIKTQYHKD